jgi:extracellular elastinolytic metalloproteinase
MSGLPPKDEVLEKLYLRHRWNCEHVRSSYEIEEMGFQVVDSESGPDDVRVADPRNALLWLVVAASPQDSVRIEILNNHDQIRENMTSLPNHHFTGENYGTLVEIIDNVPDVVSPVKAKPVYYQLRDGDKATLVQAWLVSRTEFCFLYKFLSRFYEFEVEMRDNWYEAVVSRHVPHRILSVVGRVKDASVPLEPTLRPPVAEFEERAH